VKSNFNPKRLLIIGDGSIFDEGVTQMLQQDANMLISHPIYSDDLAFLNMFQMIARPDFILVCEFRSLDTAYILNSISSHPTMMGLPLVVIKLSNTVIDLYARPIIVAGKISSKPRQIHVRKVDDLLNVVRRY
jgi:hypothetical protein